MKLFSHEPPHTHTHTHAHLQGCNPFRGEGREKAGLRIKAALIIEIKEKALGAEVSVCEFVDLWSVVLWVFRLLLPFRVRRRVVRQKGKIDSIYRLLPRLWQTHFIYIFL